jgi:hypothetical protein
MSEEEMVQEGSEAQEVEVEVTDASQEEAAEEKAKTEKGKKSGEAIREAFRQVESFGQALSDALQSRGNVVMVRVNDESLAHLDMLIEAEITNSRSESAAFLISEGIKANAVLFDRIRNITDQIAELREQLREQVNLAPEEEAEEEA